MSSDKNLQILEKQLKTLGQKIRIDILKKLNTTQSPIPFSVLQKSVLEKKNGLANFSFHLKSLKNIDLISSTSEGWFLTKMGSKIFENILSMEQVINNQKKTLMIRTSKYSYEPFDISNVKEYLMKEGGLEEYMAKNLSKEVKDRLLKTKIEYLTAPLMREYINAILLENGLENIRHKLTRLGTPPYEVSKLFNSEHHQISPSKYIERLGSHVSEQYLLLNLLPSNLADLYLSGEVALLHLNKWSLKPLSFYMNSESFLKKIFEKNPNISKKTDKSRELVKLILSFIESLNNYGPYFSEDLMLDEFNQQFLSLFNNLNHEKTLYYLSILVDQLRNYNRYHEDNKSHITLAYTFKDSGLNESTSFDVGERFLSHFEINDKFNPFIVYDYSKIINDSQKFSPFLQKSNFLFYNDESSNLINSTIINVKNSNEGDDYSAKIVLDKIMVNLDLIAKDSNQNDDRYYDLLQDKVKLIFELFTCKENLVKKKLNPLKNWRSLLKTTFGAYNEDWTHDSIKSVSFFGLNNAVRNHCGIELDRIDQSELFAVKLLKLMKDLIQEKNENENSKFILSQPHDGHYLRTTMDIRKNERDELPFHYSSKIIRDESNLSLNQKITIFKKFEEIIQGGTVFTSNSHHEDDSLIDRANILMQSKVNAFTL